MDFFCSCFFQHVDQIGNGSSADNGIIHQNDSLPLHHGFQNAQLQMDTGLSLLLCRLAAGEGAPSGCALRTARKNGLSHSTDERFEEKKP